MRLISMLLAGALCATTVQANEFTWASRTDPQSMDPHAVNSTPVLSFLNNVYEGLVRLDKTLTLEGSLAESWEPIGDGDGWRFALREGVTFHDGAEFTSEDVVFSYERASDESADVRSWFANVDRVEAPDDYTVEIYTTRPDPVFPASIANWMILDKGWAEANGAERVNKEEGNYATLNANGTAAFMLVAREPGLRTVLEPNANWWGEVEHNITRAEFTPIENPATAVAALLAGDIDFVEPVPPQDADRVDERDGVRVIRGAETRVIMLGFAHEADALKYGPNAGDPNPFQDPRVRQAVAHAVNVDAILTTLMRGAGAPVAQLVTPEMNGYSESLGERPAYDPDGARALLTEAGYPDGFAFGLKCPNNRYINDEAVCQAVVGMLAQVGITAELEAMPVANYWPELREDNFDMYLLGWSPGGAFDAEHPVRFLAHTPVENLGTWNFGGFSNARVDELHPQIQSEIDPGTRQGMLDEVAGILQEETAYVPMYVQPLFWGARDNIELTLRPDNFFILRWVTVN